VNEGGRKWEEGKSEEREIRHIIEFTTGKGKK
jgi:hypothetical protein